MANLDKHQVVDTNEAILDTRKTYEQYWASFKDPTVCLPIFGILMLVALIAAPGALWIIGLLYVATKFYVTHDRDYVACLHRVPMEYKQLKDWNDYKPSMKTKLFIKKRFYNARGIISFGNCIKTLKEIWACLEDLTEHTLWIGTTGAGKSEGLTSLFASILGLGGGGIYADAKANPKLAFQLYTLLCMCGRSESWRLLNYIKPEHSDELSADINSNDSNPFIANSPDTNIEQVTSLMAEGGGDDQFFVDKAITLVRGLMPALDWKARNDPNFIIYPEVIEAHLNLQTLIDFAYSKELPEKYAKNLKNYLKNNINGFNDGQLDASKYDSKATTFHTDAVGYLQGPLSNLTNVYANIYNSDLPEIYYKDIVFNNRVLLIMIPSLGLSDDAKKSLGKLNLAGMKMAMGFSLGNKIEGDIEDVLWNLPVGGQIPFICILDEYAEMASEKVGFAIAATQGRSMSIAAVFSGQDLSGFERASKHETDMIFGSTRNKILMTMEDPGPTWERFKGIVDEDYVHLSSGKEAKGGLFGKEFSYSKNTQLTKVSRLSLKHILAQGKGEATYIHKGKIMNIQTFWHGVSDENEDFYRNHRIIRMPKVKGILPEDIEEITKTRDACIDVEEFITSSLGNNLPSPSYSPDIIEFNSTAASGINAALQAVVKLHYHDLASIANQLSDTDENTDNDNDSILNSDMENGFDEEDESPASAAQILKQASDETAEAKAQAEAEAEEQNNSVPPPELPIGLLQANNELEEAPDTLEEINESSATQSIDFEDQPVEAASEHNESPSIFEVPDIPDEDIASALSSDTNESSDDESSSSGGSADNRSLEHELAHSINDAESVKESDIQDALNESSIRWILADDPDVADFDDITALNISVSEKIGATSSDIAISSERIQADLEAALGYPTLPEIEYNDKNIDITRSAIRSLYGSSKKA